MVWFYSHLDQTVSLVFLHSNNLRPDVSRWKHIPIKECERRCSAVCAGWLPALLLLFLPQFGEDEADNQQADDDGQHAQGQRQAQGPVHRVLAELSLVTQPAVAHQGGPATRRHLTGPVTVALGLSTGGQVGVHPSVLGEQVRDGHGRGRLEGTRRQTTGLKTHSTERSGWHTGKFRNYSDKSD